MIRHEVDQGDKGAGLHVVYDYNHILPFQEQRTHTVGNDEEDD